MPFSNSDINVGITFQLDSSPNLVLQDNTDYAGFGIAPSDTVLNITVTFPNGNTGSATINPGGGSDNSIALPTDSNGNVQEGVYTFEYSLVISGATDPGTYTSTVTINWCNDCPELKIQWTIDCLCGPVVSIKDVTEYGSLWTVSSRAMTLYAPPASPAPNSWSNVSNGDVVDTGNDSVYKGDWSVSYSAVVTRNYGGYSTECTVVHNPGGNVLSTSLFTVTCNADLCDLRCCVTTLYNRWIEAKTVSFRNADVYGEKFVEVMGIVTLVRESILCGKTGEIESYINQARKLADCQEGCCDGDDSDLIVPTCSVSGQTYSFLAGSRLAVQVIGSQVTYSMDAISSSIIANTENADVTSGDGTITFTSSVSGSNPPTRTFDLRVDRSEIINQLTYLLSVSNGGTQPNLVVSEYNGKGVYSKTSVGFTPIGVGVAGAGLTWGNLPACIEITIPYNDPTAQDGHKTHVQSQDFGYPFTGLSDEGRNEMFSWVVYKRIADTVTPEQKVYIKCINEAAGTTYSWFEVFNWTSSTVLGILTQE